LDSAVTATVSLLQSLSPTIIRERTDLDWGTTLELRRPDGADYLFLVYVYNEGETQLAARLVEAREVSFWSQLFEAPDFSSRAQQMDAFRSQLQILLRHPTRITYRTRLLVCSFTCEAHVVGGWKRVGGSAGYFRFGGFRLPRGSQAVWQSPAIVASSA
jgi:hypothetical protein